MTNKSGRNESCPCGSGKKYKKCCALKETRKRGNMLLLVVVGLLMAGGVAAGISSFFSKGGQGLCPAGQVWAAEHGHCHTPGVVGQ